MFKLSPRQVHLDFHTSPLIEGIGVNFGKENFQQALKQGNISSVTMFAKCHHSMCYYPTKVGIMHPHLKFDLLGRMLDAAHEIGVNAPIYITAGWSAVDAENHPEWWVKKIDGSVSTMNYDMTKGENDSRPNCSWINLCLNDGSYAKHIYDHTREICDMYSRVDGIFYDICGIGDQCYCDECVAGMKELGFNPKDENDGKKYYIIKRQAFMEKCAEIIREKHPSASWFFNSGGADQYRPEYHAYQTHFEMEDLPTAWGGYDKMPPRAKFFAKTGKDFLGMTGKFHTEWGEFGGFKPLEAMKFEVASMLTYGAKCSIGDQMHPDGEMDLETYRTIGYAYDYVKRIEEFCYEGTLTTKLGVYLSSKEKSDEGLVKMLLETQNDFDIVYNDDFERFDTVIFPDYVVLSDEAACKLSQFVQNGGNVVFTGESLVKEGKFQLDPGAEYDGSYGYEKDYLVVGEAISTGMVTSPFLCYTGASKVIVTDGEVLSTVMLPYFNRTYKTYCSHKNTPYNKENGGHPGMIRKGNIIYIAHKVCEMYEQYGSIYHRRYFINALNLLYKNKVLSVSMTSAGRAALIKQKGENRYCLNLLYGSPIKRTNVDVIEDLPVINNIPVSIQISEKIKRVYMPVSGVEVPFEQKYGKLEFTVPYLQSHQLVVMDY